MSGPPALWRPVNQSGVGVLGGRVGDRGSQMVGGGKQGMSSLQDFCKIPHWRYLDIELA